ncbi:hypothetical protein [Nocardiopsis sp. CA-288880]|uniref:hypothetical protein n=1 Tax=Nocardiopsis sp. CA-288880 TaxID=3239995 RepID=UPI003D96D163
MRSSSPWRAGTGPRSGRTTNCTAIQYADHRAPSASTVSTALGTNPIVCSVPQGSTPA